MSSEKSINAGFGVPDKVTQIRKSQRMKFTNDPGGEMAVPNCLDTEEELLATLLMDRDTILKVSSILSPEDFFSDSHANLYAAVMDCYLRGVPPDLITVRDSLKAMGALGTGEGQTSGVELVRIMRSYASPVHCVYYAQIIARYSFLRKRIIRTAEATGMYFMPEASANPDKIAQKEIEWLRQDLAWYSKMDKSSYIRTHNETLEYLERDEAATKEAGMGATDPWDGTKESKPKPKRARFGFPNFDGIDGQQMPSAMMLPSTCTTVLAATGKGKTTFLENVAESNARAGLNVLFIATELGIDQMEDRRLCRLAGVDFMRLALQRIEHNILTTEEYGRVAKAMDHIQKWPGKIDYFNALGMKASEIVNEIESRQAMMQALTGEGYNFICLDYLGRVRAEDGLAARGTEAQQINDNMLRLSEMANRMKIPLLLASQVNRGSNQDIKVDSAKGSSGIEHYSNLMLSLKTDENNNTTIEVLKQNFGRSGFELTLTLIPNRFQFKYVDDFSDMTAASGNIISTAQSTDTIPDDFFDQPF